MSRQWCVLIRGWPVAVSSSVPYVSLMLSDSLTDTLCLEQQNRTLHQHTLSFIHHYNQTSATYTSNACHIHSIKKTKKQSEQIWNTDRLRCKPFKHWLLIAQYEQVRQDAIMKTASSSLMLSSPQHQTAHGLCRNWTDNTTCQASGLLFTEVNKCLWSFKPQLQVH